MKIITPRRTLLFFGIGVLFFAITFSLGSQQAQAILAPCPPSPVLSDEIQRVAAFGQFNQARSLMNADQSGTKIPLLVESKDWSIQAFQHAYYIYATSDISGGADIRTEFITVSTPTCYTPTGFDSANNSMSLGSKSISPTLPSLLHLDLSLAAGASAAITRGIDLNSVISPSLLVTTGIDVANRYLNTIYLRAKILNPRLQNIGFGMYPAGQRGVSSSAALDTDHDYNASGGFAGRPVYQPAVYPAAGQQNVPLSMPCGEQPDPLINFGFGACPGRTPVGYAITVLFDQGTTFIPTSSTLQQIDSAGNVTNIPYVEIVPFSQIVRLTTIAANLNVFALVPRSPLTANTTYGVTVRGLLDGVAYQRQWTFTTGNFNSDNSVANPLATTTPDTRPILIPSQTPVPTLTPTPGFPAFPVFPPPGNGSAGFFTLYPSDTTNPTFYRLWLRTDDPVYTGRANRSWIYGDRSFGFTTLLEAYGTGFRLVNYHDKARIEAVNNTTSNTTNGLLVREMILGSVQVGDSIFIPRVSAQVAIAGDIAETNINSPTYASFRDVASLSNDRRVPNQVGQTVVATIAKDGTINVNPGTGAYGAVNVYYDNTLGHNIPNIFWDFMNQQGTINVNGSYVTGQIVDWVPVFGLPLSEAYWTRVFVGNEEKDVLVQVFERRTLTYAPTNPPAFRVEMGNVGRHYYKWRYGVSN